MIRTIISDLGNVLLHFDHMRSCDKVARACGKAPERIYELMFSSGLEQEYDVGRISSDTFAERVGKLLGGQVDADTIRRSWQEIFWPVEGMEALIRGLKGNYRLVLLSNTNDWHFTYCHGTFPFIALFDHYALSYKLGVRKPDPAIFEKALAMAGSEASESVFMDDIGEYVDAARSLGIHGLVFESCAKLKREFSALGIEVDDRG